LADAAPQNFDEFYNGNRAFIIGGGTFHWRPLHWREWGELLDARAEEEARQQKERQDKIDALIEKGIDQYEAEDTVDDEGTVVESFEKVITRICVYLEPEEETAFMAVVNDRTKSISLAQMNALMLWLQERQTPDRPTEALSSSSSGPGTQGATSPAA
jgi:hypothetical protein